MTTTDQETIVEQERTVKEERPDERKKAVKKENTVTLYTEEGERLAALPEEPVWQEYPRPQMKRDSFLCLNGPWELELLGEHNKQTVRVPFPPQAALSGWQGELSEGSLLAYRRSFTLPAGFLKSRLLLHVDGADQELTAFVNDRKVGIHQGGYDPAVFDITEALVRGENQITLLIMDQLDEVFPYGKQTLKRGGMWYTPFSGLWKSVWLESVPKRYIRSLSVETKGTEVTVRAEGIPGGRVEFPEEEGLAPVPLSGGADGSASAHFTVEDPRWWSPESPYLYRFRVVCGEDAVESYFALRTLEIRQAGGKPRLCLNGKPYFFHGLLDQGYWSDGLVTPASPEAFREEILRLKALGFNTLRKHIKVEHEIFYYECDRLGMIVWQDMVNNGKYRFMRDTALPTVGKQTLDDTRINRDPKTRAEFLRQMETTVRLLKNHPCICLWTIFNEGWGQFSSSEAYEALRALDDTRFIDSASGWFRGGKTDIESRHVYFKPLKPVISDKPFCVTEFGGVVWKPEGHAFNPAKTYGYGKANTREAWVEAVRKLYEEQVIPLVKEGLCAAIYTQVSDVEDEVNGLFSYDRRVQKLMPEEFADVGRRLGEELRRICEG